MTARVEALSSLEVATGLVFGLRRLDRAPVAHSPLVALEQAILPALERPPCLVSFSGGRDSSTVLAAATRVAHREGLEPPIPATNRFPAAPASDEAEWQESVVAELGLSDWLRLEFRDELDCVGPVARKVLRRHGLLWPFNVHFHAPLLAAASGGSLLTGIGGDELLGEARSSHALAVLAGRRRPQPRDLLRVGWAIAPAPLRRLGLRGRLPLAFEWLTPAARRDVIRAWRRDTASEPIRWSRQMRWRAGFRYLELGTRNLALVAADEDVRLVHPLLDASFVATLAALERGDRYPDRSAAHRALAGGLLSEKLLTRRSKSSFDEAFWSRWSREFAAAWDGGGVDPDVVDIEALRAEWASEAPDPRTFTLVQAAWLASASRSDEVEQQVDFVVG
jgi:asparagine synthase (glutamine-hydrolysing)